MRGRTERHGWSTIFAIAILLSGAWAPGLLAQDVTIDIGITGNASFGQTVNATANVTVNDGSTITGIAWTQRHGATVVFTAPAAATTGIQLAGRNAYRDYLVHIMEEPPISNDDLPENVQVPEGEFHGGLPDRFQVVGPNPFALEEAGLVEVMVAVTTTSGTYRKIATIHVSLPWLPATSLRNVPVQQAVVLHGKEQDSYNWRMVAKPAGSQSHLVGSNSRNPEFWPDLPGEYQIRIFDEAADEALVLSIFAGFWQGIIVGQDSEGLPIAEPACMTCHGVLDIAEDQFTPWRETGHARIFSDQLDTSTHYGPNCMTCHTVGLGPKPNMGIDDEPQYPAFLAAGLLNNPGDNWTTMLEDFPDVAKKANIQCENCHGPGLGGVNQFDTPAHGLNPALMGDEPRTSLASDVCATCHGEPLRHARFQQWQLSGHANYELAIDESSSGSCARCHTGNGFLEWLPVLLGDEPGDPLDNIAVNWETDDTHPITCATCHDPHAIGTTSGDDTDATVRISGNTPELIAGFQVLAAGKGAICMTCHNSRRGLFNDQTYETAMAPNVDREPHGSSQADVLMGENAFLINTGVRGAHSFLTDTCVTCHMSETPPPDILSYNQGGTNHTFEAGITVCANCHQGIESAEALQTVMMAVSSHVEELMEQAILDLMRGVINDGNILVIGGTSVSNAADVRAVDWGVDENGDAIASRGAQAVNVRLAGGVIKSLVRLSTIEVDRPDPLSTIPLYDFASEEMIKAGWNWFLIHNDSSYGAHNPSWSLAVLDAARDALGGLGGPRADIPYTPDQLALKDGVPVKLP